MAFEDLRKILGKSAASQHHIAARFLGLLELYRDGDVAFDQAAALAELRVRWIGGDQARQDRDPVDAHEPAPHAQADHDPDEEYG